MNSYSRCAWAYPRSRGGTFANVYLDPLDQGLSPLARGNLCDDAPSPPSTGPIPARAGEPWWCRHRPLASWAYPRSRGGTYLMKYLSKLGEGLSPLARGNLLIEAL